MAASDTLAGFQASVDARDSASVLRVIAALRAARSSLLSENKMLFITCAGGTCPNDISALLEEWDYQQIAKIPASNTLCFAQAREVAGPVDGSVGRAAQKSRSLAMRVDSALRANESYRQARGFLLDVAGSRPSTLRGRKLQKLLVSPYEFFEDSGHPVLAKQGLRLFQMLAPGSRSKKVTIYDVPKCTLLLCFGPGESVDREALELYTDGLGLATELVVVLPAELAKTASSIIKAACCPRVRVYTINGSFDEMLRYGLARSYARNIALLATGTRCSSEEIHDGFAQLTRDCDEFFDRDLGLVGARRSLWRDFLDGARPSSKLDEALQVIRWQFNGVNSTALVESPELSAAVASSWSQYPGVHPTRPFAPLGRDASVVHCHEQSPRWPHRSTANWEQQESLISVIMTVYNAGETVQAAIDSVLAQTYSNLELLVVDDCSTDDSLSILREISATDKRVRILQTSTNSGTYVAKNVGLRFARGMFVTFHDSDDISSSNRLAFQAIALSSDPDAIANYTRYQRLSEDGSEVWLNDRSNRPGYITLMIRRVAAIAAVGFFDSVRVSADAEYVERLKIATGREVRLLPAVTYYALQAEGSLTTAGVAAFVVDAEGNTTLPPLRAQYRDAARSWHESIYEGQSSAQMPFPLRQRPFVAPKEVLPRRGQTPG